jgi:hypothetical protein
MEDCPCEIYSNDECINKDDIEIATFDNISSYDPNDLVILPSGHCISKYTFNNLDPLINPFTRANLRDTIKPLQTNNGIVQLVTGTDTVLRTTYNVLVQLVTGTDAVLRTTYNVLQTFALIVVFIYNELYANGFRTNMVYMGVFILFMILDYIDLDIVNETDMTYDDHVEAIVSLLEAFDGLMQALAGGGSGSESELDKFKQFCNTNYMKNIHADTTEQITKNLKVAINNSLSRVLKLNRIPKQATTSIKEYLTVVNEMLDNNGSYKKSKKGKNNRTKSKKGKKGKNKSKKGKKGKNKS